MERIGQIENPPQYGAILTFALSIDGNTLIIGTSKGIINVWDIRFITLINSWSFGDNIAISQIESSPELGKDKIVVIGGMSNTILTVWNFEKPQCQKAFIEKDQQPPLHLFQPKSNNLDNLPFQKDKIEMEINSILIIGSLAIISKGINNDIVFLDLKKPSSSRILSHSNAPGSSFTPVHVTTSLELVLRKQLEQKKKKKPLFSGTSHQDRINSIIYTRLGKKYLLFFGDNSGVISVIN